MAPRANWKGFLRLSLVTCPVALYPATSESEKISFNQLNRATGHRIKYLKVDADTGDEVPNEDIVKGYQLEKDQFIEVTKEELEEIALESTRTLEIDEFVDRSDIDPRYLIRPYYIRPDGKVGHDAFAVIRETIREMNKVAIGRVVLNNREHIIGLEPLDKGLVGTLLRYPYEVRSEQEYFDEIQDVKVTKDMLDLAKHIVNQKAGRFDPEKFEDHYETALIDLINQKRAGKPITSKEKPAARNVVDLMEALRRSVGQEAAPAKAAKPAKKPRKAPSGQKEMLMSIEGKKPNEAAAKKSAARPQRKSRRRRVRPVSPLKSLSLDRDEGLTIRISGDKNRIVPLETFCRIPNSSDVAGCLRGRAAETGARTVSGACSYPSCSKEDLDMRYDWTPLWRSSIGFDRLFDALDEVQRTAEETYPPYNIERIDENSFRISVALAGFSPDEVTLTAEHNVLTLEGRKTEKEDKAFLHRGISNRNFKRRFTLADYVEVKGARFENGLLLIDLQREIPEAMKPRQIEINGAAPGKVTQIESKAA